MPPSAKSSTPVMKLEASLARKTAAFPLCRAFRDEVGLPPHAYLVHLRIARALALLLQAHRRGDSRAVRAGACVRLRAGYLGDARAVIAHTRLIRSVLCARAECRPIPPRPRTQRV